MKILDFEEIAEFGNLFYEIASKEGSVVTAVLFYDTAQELLKWLMQYEDVTIGHIDFCNGDYGYTKEFYITLDTDLVLDIEPVYRDSKYQVIDTDAMFFDGDANSRIAIINDDCLQFELEIKEEHEDDKNYAALESLIDYITSIMED